MSMPRRFRTGAVTVAVLAGALLGGCASSKAAQPGGPPPSGAGGAGAVSSVTVVHETDNGTTVHVKVGGEVILEDFSSLWGVPASSSEAVLSDASAKDGRPGCASAMKPPGQGCHVPQILYKAAAAGTATIKAHRDQCGEAMRCVPPNSSDFAITVVVG